MDFRTLLKGIAEVYPGYRATKTVSRTAPVYGMVVNEAPEVLRGWAPDFPELQFEGSTGQGNITAAPWIRAYFPTLSASAQDGFYLVYLFTTNLEEVVLTLGIGATQFTSRFGEVDGVRRLRNACDEFARITSELIPVGVVQGPTNLGTQRKGDLHYAYSQGAVFSLPPYKVGALPTDEQLKADFLTLCRAYEELRCYPLTPEIQDLVDAVTPVVPPSAPIVEQPFEVLPPKKGGNKNGHGNGGGNRRSKESKLVGDRGEAIAIEAEKARLTAAGRPDLAVKIIHVSALGEFPGYDILSFETDGAQRLIEVKASAGKSVASIELTANEWKTASDPVNRNAYHLFLVTNVFGAAKIQVLQNPFSYVESGTLEIRTSIFALNLRATSGSASA